MIVRARPVRGTFFHVHDRKKYYPEQVYSVDEETGAKLIKLRIADEIQPTQPPKRGPGRPRKNPQPPPQSDDVKPWPGPPMPRRRR